MFYGQINKILLNSTLTQERLRIWQKCFSVELDFLEGKGEQKIRLVDFWYSFKEGFEILVV